MKKHVLRWLPPLSWMLLIHLVSGMRGSDLPESPVPYLDKVAHFGIYAILSILYYRAFYGMERWQPWTCVLLCVLVSTGYGAWDEYRQASIEGRSSEGWDLMADALGASLAAGIPWLIKHKPDWVRWLK